MIRRCLVIAAVVACVGALPFGKKKENDDAELLKNFDPNAQLAQMLSNPDMVAEMQQMLKDPKTMEEVQKLVADPEFKKKIENFQQSDNFEGAKQMFGKLMADPNAPQKMKGDVQGLAAEGALGADGARGAAAEKARMDMEYEKCVRRARARATRRGKSWRGAHARARPPPPPPRYKSQFTGDQSAQKGLSMMSEAAKDPSMLMDSLNALKDPEMMKEVQEMMADPAFQAEMQKIMADPSMQQAMQQSREYVSELAKDPKRLEQVQAQMEGLLGGVKA